MKTLAAMSVLSAALFALGWADAFHLVMMFLALLAASAAWFWWKQRSQPEEPEADLTPAADDEGPTTADRLRAAFLGMLVGLGILALAAALSAAASATPLYGLFYDRGCDDTLSKAQILEGANDYAAALATVEPRLRQRASQACRERLAEKRARLLINLADSASGSRQEELLRQALEQSQQLHNNDLVSLVRSRRQLAELKSVIDKLQTSQVNVHNTENGLAFELPDVLFEPGSATLASSTAQAVDQIAGLIRKQPGKSVQVNGYTDNTGTQEFNQQLSQARAESVARLLVAQGIPQNHITAQGFGASNPAVPNDSPEGRSRNRRVVVVILN